MWHCGRASCPTGGVKPATEPGPLADEPAVLACSRCHEAITTEADWLEVGGAREHRFMNPHGFWFASAASERPGRWWPRAVGATIWSWFPPCAWQVRQCTRCRQHLGWQFRSPERRFYGLVLDRLGAAGSKARSDRHRSLLRASGSPGATAAPGEDAAARAERRYARSAGRTGSRRSRLPVAANTAFITAGATGGRPGSPIPVGGSVALHDVHVHLGHLGEAQHLEVVEVRLLAAPVLDGDGALQGRGETRRPRHLPPGRRRRRAGSRGRSRRR